MSAMTALAVFGRDALVTSVSCALPQCKLFPHASASLQMQQSSPTLVCGVSFKSSTHCIQFSPKPGAGPTRLSLDFNKSFKCSTGRRISCDKSVACPRTVHLGPVCAYALVLFGLAQRFEANCKRTACVSDWFYEEPLLALSALQPSRHMEGCLQSTSKSYNQRIFDKMLPLLQQCC
jgi:hypothetical protein